MEIYNSWRKDKQTLALGMFYEQYAKEQDRKTKIKN